MCQECNDKIKQRKALEKATGHRSKDIGVGMSDQIQCSCGWKSNGYWDGLEWAIEEFDRHLEKVR